MIIFSPCGPPPPHPIMHVSFLKLRWVAWELGWWEHSHKVYRKLGLSCACSRAGPCVLLPSAECGLWVGQRSVKQLCNPLDADQGAPHSPRRPSDWLGMGTRDRHVAILAQPASVSLETEWRCCRAWKWGRCWSRNGPLAAEGGGDYFSSYCLKTGGFSLAQGSRPLAKRGGRGVSLPPPFYCSTGDGFPVLLILGFWQKRKKGGWVGVLRGG